MASEPRLASGTIFRCSIGPSQEPTMQPLAGFGITLDRDPVKAVVGTGRVAGNHEQVQGARRHTQGRRHRAQKKPR